MYKTIDHFRQSVSLQAKVILLDLTIGSELQVPCTSPSTTNGNTKTERDIAWVDIHQAGTFSSCVSLEKSCPIAEAEERIRTALLASRAAATGVYSLPNRVLFHRAVVSKNPLVPFASFLCLC